MPSLGLSEIFLVVIILFLVIKPADVPRVANRIGAMFKGLQKMRSDLMKEVRDIQRIGTLDELDKKVDNTSTSTKTSQPETESRSEQPSNRQEST